MSLQVRKAKLVPRGPISLIRRVYRYILPEVREELKRWKKQAERIPDDELRKQALASIKSKQFHCQGGAVYAAAKLEQRHILIPLIVAFQTISDYLDNLCDRSTSLDERDFRQLHQAMLDAIDPEARVEDYYAFREEQEDGGYLAQLVRTCQSCLTLLPSYHVAKEDVRKLVSLYCDLQVYKHLRHDLREQKLLDWWSKHHHEAPDYYWNEFAAATGSTLGMFMLFLASSEMELSNDEVRSIRDAYFPSICGLHIMLDYLIDQAEDQIGGDLNFCFYYEDNTETIDRMDRVVSDARASAARLKHPRFHQMIVDGLIALYLSDPKVRTQQNVRQVANRLMRKGSLSRMFFWMNSIWIRKVF